MTHVDGRKVASRTGTHALSQKRTYLRHLSFGGIGSALSVVTDRQVPAVIMRREITVVIGGGLLTLLLIIILLVILF